MKKLSSKSNNKPKWLNSKFESKPSYNLYNKLWYTLKSYLMTRIDTFIFFQYYNWDISIIKNIKKNNFKNLYILKEIYEYDYKVFKMYLFLYWDLEYYLEGKDDVKNKLKIDKENWNLVILNFSKEIKSYNEFLYLISIRKAINLWTNLEILGMFKKMLNYDIYSKIETLNTKYKNHSKIKTYKKYKKYNDLISVSFIIELRQLQDKDLKIEPSFYVSYIEKWYEEWKSEITLDLTFKYKKKIKQLDIELKTLIKTLNKHNETNE